MRTRGTLAPRPAALRVVGKGRPADGEGLRQGGAMTEQGQVQAERPGPREDAVRTVRPTPALADLLAAWYRAARAEAAAKERTRRPLPTA